MKRTFFLLPLLCLFPMAAQAHVQWFVTPDQMKDAALPLDAVSLWMTLGVLACVVVAVLLTRFGRAFSFSEKLLCRVPPLDHRLYMIYFMAVMSTFFVMILLQGGFLAPNLILPEHLLPLGVFLQTIIVVCATFSVSLAGVFLLVTTLAVVILFPSISLNYLFELGSLGIFMVLNGPVVSTVDQWAIGIGNAKRFWNLSISVLRIGIGLQLAILALVEKLLRPGLALVFVESYPFYNFFPALGLEQVGNLHFVYFIGICEFTLGTMLMFGVAVRLVLAALAVAFTTTAIIHGVHEILGHLPIFAAAVVLLLECANNLPVAQGKPQRQHRRPQRRARLSMA
ncbi:MAG: hypothetical protein LBB76_01360 [Azoarcus sp.]|jgi:hypothetical protein|nr:hypothetical protein [Azoarcus sp.]